MGHRRDQGIRNVVVYVSDLTVRFGYYQHMRCKCRFGIVGQHDGLKRNINLHIFRNIEEYPAVPYRGMQSDHRMLVILKRLVQIRLNQIRVFFNRCFQIGENDAFGDQFRSQTHIYGSRIALDNQTAFS